MNHHSGQQSAGRYEQAPPSDDNLAAALARSEANVRAAAAAMEQHGAGQLSHLAPRPGDFRPGDAATTAPSVVGSGNNRAPIPQYTPLRIPPPGMPLPSMENMLLTEIVEPHDNDVLCGRGGGTNNHVGNEKFRDLVNSQKVLYLHSCKRDKPFVSRAIVRAVRAQTPPGRFLQKDESTGFYYDIGDHKAREKTSQALREGAPEIRSQLTSPVKTSSHQKIRRTVGLAAPSPPSGGGSPQILQPSSSGQTPREYNGAEAPSGGMYMQGGDANMEAAMHARAASNGRSFVGAPMDHPGMMDASGRAQMLSDEARAVAAMGGSPYGRAYPPGSASRPLMSMDHAHHMGMPPMESELRALAMSSSSHPVDPRLQSAAAAAAFHLGGVRNNNHNGGPPHPNMMMKNGEDGRARHLEFAETIAQRTANGTITEELRAEEKRMSLYLDAGVLGIPPSEMAERVARGETEFVIVEQRYNELKEQAKNKQPDGEKKKKASGKRAADSESLSVLDKKARLYGASSVKGHPVLSEKHIHDALVAIGGV